MAGKKISQLSEETYIKAADDFLVISDSSANETKKIRPENLPLSSAFRSEILLTTTWFDTGNAVTQNLTFIGNTDGFISNDSIEAIFFGSSVTGIGTQAFQDCTNLTSVNIGNSVTSIGSQAFEGCSNLTKATIVQGITEIPDYCFKDCDLSSFVVPNSVLTINQQAFAGNATMTDITIGSSVISMGQFSFVNCNNLSRINCYAQNPPTFEVNTFANVPTNTEFHVPQGAAYESTYAGFNVTADL